jgi:hypothetical protein
MRSIRLALGVVRTTIGIGDHLSPMPTARTDTLQEDYHLHASRLSLRMRTAVFSNPQSFRIVIRKPKPVSPLERVVHQHPVFHILLYAAPRLQPLHVVSALI